MKLITEKMSTLGEGKSRAYLVYVEKCLINLRDNDKFINIRTRIEENNKELLKRLKKARKKAYKIKVDELTGEKLKRNSEFSHIRAKSIYRRNALDINNGLLVNPETHRIITSRKITNEEELLELCKEKEWDTSWYKIFKNLVY